jgi:hypothetical protein
VVAAGAMQCRDPIRRWRAVVADLPLVGQLGHREQLILDGPQILVADGVASAYSPCAKSPGTNPAAHGLWVLTHTVGSLGYGQHVEDGTPRFGSNPRHVDAEFCQSCLAIPSTLSGAASDPLSGHCLDRIAPPPGHRECQEAPPPSRFREPIRMAGATISARFERRQVSPILLSARKLGRAETVGGRDLCLQRVVRRWSADTLPHIMI